MDNFESNEEAEEAVRSIGQTPMLDSVQEMLKKQQLKELREKSLALDDLEEDLKRTSNERETLGVQLYNLQQQLANSQIKLEQTQEEIIDASHLGGSAQEDARKRKSILEDILAETKDMESKLRMAKEEENSAKAAVKQVEAFLEETKSEIAVLRRATHKTEANVNSLEKEKEKQDLYIDSRVERIKQLQQEIGLIAAQLKSQALETKAAEDTLREANDEMQATQFEKKHVVQSWNSTIISLQRRDEAFQSMQDSIKSKQEEQLAIRSEIQGYRSSVLKVQGESEMLVERKIRQEHGLKQVDDNLSLIEKDYAKLSERYSMMKKSLEQQERESRSLKGILISCTNQVQSLQSQIQVIDRQRFAMEEETSQHFNDKTTMSKAAKNLSQSALGVQKQIHNKEMEHANLENEHSRVTIDKLNTKAHAQQLEKELEKKLQLLQDQDRLIEKYKLEIRQRNDEVEKKMYVVDRLNRKYETMVANQDEPENLGPLEATINSLTKETASLNQQNRELERQWLKIQTSFVQVVNEKEQESSHVHELASTETILEQKKKRLDNQIHAQTQELKDLENNIRKMHNEMHKLNELIADHSGKYDQLLNVNESMQSEFVNELKELEQQSVQFEGKIEKTKMEKKTLLDEIMEYERQIKLWEKKIQLEKETQAALDPTVGQSEVKAMEKEIHRMKIRFDNLTREQEKMIKEMEVAILKRETLTSRKKIFKSPAAKKNRSSDEALSEMTQADLKRGIKLEKKEVKKLQDECGRFENGIRERILDSENIAMELEKATNVFSKTEERIKDTKDELNEGMYLKQRNAERINRTQALIEKYIEFSKNPATQIPMCQEEADIQLDESQDQIQNILQTVKLIEGGHPHLKQVLDRVAKLLVD